MRLLSWSSCSLSLLSMIHARCHVGLARKHLVSSVSLQDLESFHFIHYISKQCSVTSFFSKHIRRKGRSDLVAPRDITGLFFLILEFFFQKILLKNNSQKLLHVTNFFSPKKSYIANEINNNHKSQTT